MPHEDERSAMQQRIAELEQEVARLRQQSQAANDLQARLVQVKTASILGMPGEHSALLEQIVATAMHVIGARAGSLYLLDEETDDLVFEVALGEGSPPLRGVHLPLGQGVAGWVAATGQVIAIADVQQDPRWAQDVAKAAGYQPKSMLVMPLILRDETIGVLQLLDKNGGEPFSANDIATLGLFANQAAIAIAQSGTVRSLKAMMRSLLIGTDGSGDLSREAAAVVAGIEEQASFKDIVRLATYLGELVRYDDASRRLGLTIAGAIVDYVQSLHRVGR